MQQGLTLVSLLVGMVLIIVLAALSVPAWHHLIIRHQQAHFLAQFSQFIADAQLQSQLRGVPLFIRVNQGEVQLNTACTPALDSSPLAQLPLQPRHARLSWSGFHGGACAVISPNIDDSTQNGHFHYVVDEAQVSDHHVTLNRFGRLALTPVSH